MVTLQLVLKPIWGAKLGNPAPNLVKVQGVPWPFLGGQQYKAAILVSESCNSFQGSKHGFWDIFFMNGFIP
jgi:hypothetical protein